MTQRAIWTLAVMTGCSAFACGEDEPDPAAVICDALDSSGSPITAVTTKSGAPAMTIGTGYRVTLPDQMKGYVKITVAADTAVTLGLSVKDVLTGFGKGDEEPTTPAGAALDECPSKIPEHFDLDLHTAGDWFITLGPAAVSDVFVMAVPSEGHGDE